MGFINVHIALGILAWPFLAMMAMFLVAAPNSASNPLVIGLFFSMLGYPIPAIWGCILFFKNRKKGNDKINMKYTLIGASGYIAMFVLFFLLELIRVLSQST
ncbi:hypothetical protein [Thalassotalea piscium]|uniref:Uncharacterized protein n=1 Tax=Thalassotalea piscium TaxID=1230533 RepID=A0A7X0TVB5_9GAMM|nr:hypothetical protein [Thalassotalea piscium]MBB6545176.1 hypothetical protein [Thalassotalea piscium]